MSNFYRDWIHSALPKLADFFVGVRILVALRVAPTADILSTNNNRTRSSVYNYCCSGISGVSSIPSAANLQIGQDRLTDSDRSGPIDRFGPIRTDCQIWRTRDGTVGRQSRTTIFEHDENRFADSPHSEWQRQPTPSTNCNRTQSSVVQL